MTLITVLDRELPDKLKSMLAYQRRAPLHIRLVSQHIYDFSLDGTSIFEILRKLRTRKDASIALLLDRKRYQEASLAIKEEIQKLEGIGVRFHTVRDLHAKIVTVENNQEKCALVTSANLSHHAYYESHEIGLYCQDICEVFKSIKKYITHLIMGQNP